MSVAHYFRFSQSCLRSFISYSVSISVFILSSCINQKDTGHPEIANLQIHKTLKYNGDMTSVMVYYSYSGDNIPADAVAQWSITGNDAVLFQQDSVVISKNGMYGVTLILTTADGSYSTVSDELVISNIFQHVSPRYEEYKSDTMRFIAHAGGLIDGNRYTNCKEALDNSYKIGFRVFELDILKTLDDSYVACHDWKSWRLMSGYFGLVPVSSSTFLQYKILKQYTPLSIVEINQWFGEHADAILVTDKINDPAGFSAAFIDPSRLIMELFDMDAVKAGINANIRSAMPSQSIIDSTTKAEIAGLRDMGVKNIAIRYSFIADHKELLEEYQANGINAYVFSFMDSVVDEDYVVRNDMDLFYGIYADEWSFE